MMAPFSSCPHCTGERTDYGSTEGRPPDLSPAVGTGSQRDCAIEPPNSVILLVSREEFTLPASFGWNTAVATLDCVAVAVLSVDDGPATVIFEVRSIIIEPH